MKPGGRALAAVLALLVLAAAVAPPTAEAGGAAVSVALGLASFAVFNQLFGWPVGPAYAERVVVYAPPPAYVSAPAYAQPPVVYSSPSIYYTSPRVVVAPPAPSVVEYPHGRYELRGDGVSVGYHWVWIPRMPPPPPPPAGTPPPPPR